MKKLMMSLAVTAVAVMIAGCESKEVKEFKEVAKAISAEYEKRGMVFPESEIDKAIEEFKSASPDKQKEMLDGARHKLERNKAGKGLKCL